MATASAQELWKACREGNLPKVSSLLEKEKEGDLDLDPNWQEEHFGTSPFFMACKEGHLPLVTRLSQDPRIDINLPTSTLLTPFFIACQEGHLPIALHLLQDPRTALNRPNHHGVSPFLMACFQGHVELSAALARHRLIDVNMPNKYGETPFYLACNEGHVWLVGELAKIQRIDVNLAALDSSTPLWAATAQRHLRVVMAIFASGRKIDTQKVCDWTRTSPARWAWIIQRPDIAELIEEYERDPFRIARYCRRELGMEDDFAADVFALIVFFCDELLLFCS